jgi:hypothetical protein
LTTRIPIPALAIKEIQMKTLILLMILLPAFHREGPTEVRCKNSSVKMSPIDWTTTKDWALYYIKSKRAFAFSVDTLKNFKSVRLDQNDMKKFLATAAPLPAERTPYWMGYYIASCRLSDDSLIKIEISQYGRFFYAEKDKCYYQLSEDVQDNWMAYLIAKWRTLEGITD